MKLICTIVIKRMWVSRWTKIWIRTIQHIMKASVSRKFRCIIDFYVDKGIVASSHGVLLL